MCILPIVIEPGAICLVKIPGGRSARLLVRSPDSVLVNSDTRLSTHMNWLPAKKITNWGLLMWPNSSGTLSMSGTVKLTLLVGGVFQVGSQWWDMRGRRKNDEDDND
jgi:hypothetical protein